MDAFASNGKSTLKRVCGGVCVVLFTLDVPAVPLKKHMGEAKIQKLGLTIGVCVSVCVCLSVCVCRFPCASVCLPLVKHSALEDKNEKKTT